MKLVSLGSGSKGNATVIEVGDTRLLVDCGFGLKEVEARLKNKNVDPASISAVLITHEHGDHIKGVSMLANKYHLDVYATHGTARHLKRRHSNVNIIIPNRRFRIGNVDVDPVTVPHDCSEPSQFICRHNGHSMGLLTDLGAVTAHILNAYRECDLLMLECNYDPEMLQNGPYPASLKKRVDGRFGHLSNLQAAEFLKLINLKRLKHLLISHVSEQNNDVSLAKDALAPVLDGEQTTVICPSQQEGCDWIQLTH